MNLKEKRQEIYDFIKKEIGIIRPEILGVLSEKIKVYSKLHNETILKELTELKKEKSLIKPIKTVVKPKFDPNYFNSDFLKK